MMALSAISLVAATATAANTASLRVADIPSSNEPYTMRLSDPITTDQLRVTLTGNFKGEVFANGNSGAMEMVAVQFFDAAGVEVTDAVYQVDGTDAPQGGAHIRRPINLVEPYRVVSDPADPWGQWGPGSDVLSVGPQGQGLWTGTTRVSAGGFETETLVFHFASEQTAIAEVRFYRNPMDEYQERFPRHFEVADGTTSTTTSSSSSTTTAEPAAAAVEDHAYDCDTSVHFVPGLAYSQIALTDGCKQVGGVQVCDANPKYGGPNDASKAIAYCKDVCDQRSGCTGFFFQTHGNGHQICGFYSSAVGHGSPGSNGAVCTRVAAGAPPLVTAGTLTVLNDAGHVQWTMTYVPANQAFVDDSGYFLKFGSEADIGPFFAGALPTAAHMVQGGAGWENDGGMQLQPSKKITRPDGSYPFHRNEAYWSLDEATSSTSTSSATSSVTSASIISLPTKSTTKAEPAPAGRIEASSCNLQWGDNYFGINKAFYLANPALFKVGGEIVVGGTSYYIDAMQIHSNCNSNVALVYVANSPECVDGTPWVRTEACGYGGKITTPLSPADSWELVSAEPPTSTTTAAAATTAATTTTTQQLDKKELHRIKAELLDAEAERFAEAADGTAALTEMVAESEQRAASDTEALRAEIRASADSATDQLGVKLESLHQQISGELAGLASQVEAEHDELEQSVSALLVDALASLRDATFGRLAAAGAPSIATSEQQHVGEASASTADHAAGTGSGRGASAMGSGGVAAVVCVCLLVGAAVAAIVMARRARKNGAAELSGGARFDSGRKAGHDGAPSEPCRSPSALTAVVVASEKPRRASSCYENGLYDGLAPIPSNASAACTENSEATYTLATAAGPFAAEGASNL